MARVDLEHTELQDVGVDAGARDEGGEAALQVGEGAQGRVRWGLRGGCGGGAVEKLLDAQEAGFEEGDGGKGGLVECLIVHRDCDCLFLGELRIKLLFSLAGRVPFSSLKIRMTSAQTNSLIALESCCRLVVASTDAS